MCVCVCLFVFFFSSRRRHTRLVRDWSSDVCSSDLTYDLDIKNGLFDIIELGHVTGKGKYDGRRLFIETAEAIRHDGKITAHGSVPFDFNISSPNIGRFFPGDSLDFHAQSQLGSLPFLSPYIVDLDSVRGELDLSLSLTGPVESIQRKIGRAHV